MHSKVDKGPYFSGLSLSFQNFKHCMDLFITKQDGVIAIDTDTTRSDRAIRKNQNLLKDLKTESFSIDNFLLHDISNALDGL